MIKKQKFYTNCIAWGDNILYRGVEDGDRFSKKIYYKPSLFLPSKKETEYKTIDGSFVEKMSFDGLYEAKDFVKRYEGVDNFTIYGNTYYNFCYLLDNFADDIEYDSTKILVANLDIETSTENGFPYPETANEQVVAITVQLGEQFHVFGCGEYKPAQKGVYYYKCEDEIHLLKQFLKKWTSNYPDAITGWNVAFFDIPYLVNRITKLFGEDTAKKLSPWGVFSQRKVMMYGRLQETFSLMGLPILDYIDLYKKYAPKYSQESYKLDYIAHVELGEKKLDYSEYGSLRNLYKENYQKFIEYNIKDVVLVNKLNEKLRLLELVYKLAYSAKVNYDDVLGQVRVWDNLIFAELKKAKLVVPMHKDNDGDRSYIGGYVKEPIVGKHKWVASFDVNSLYPSLIRMVNISPETLIDEEREDVTINQLLEQQFDLNFLKEKDLTISAAGYKFNRQFKGILPNMMKKLYEERKLYKQKAIEEKQELERVKTELEKRGING